MIAIIAVLIALLLPAVQAARVPRRGACVNNMKQIGLGMHDYHQTNDCFPPGAFVNRSATTPSSTGSNEDWSAHARMLPFMEQQAIFNAANFSVAVYNDTRGGLINQTASGTRLQMFLCPSCSPPAFNLIDGSCSTTAPGNNYFGSMGSTIEFDAAYTSGAPNGVIFYKAAGYTIGLRDIQDGLTNTLGFGEWKIGSGNTTLKTPATDIVFYGQYPPGVTRNTAQMAIPPARAV